MTKMAARKVNRWRQRRNTIWATNRPIATRVSIQPVPIRSMPRAIWVSHGVRRRTIWRSTAASAWSVTRRAGAQNTRTAIQATKTPSTVSHSRPVEPRLRGSGGAAPVGRRRRRERWAVWAVVAAVGPRATWSDVVMVAPSRQALLPQPPVGHPAGGLARRHLGVERPQRGGRQAGRHGVDGGGELVAPAVDDLPPHDRRDILHGLHAPVVRQHDQSAAADGGVGREQQGG